MNPFHPDFVPPPQLSDEEAKAFRKAELAALPRIGTRRIEDRQDLARRLEEIAFQVGRMHEAACARKDPDWWHLADLLDDVMDCLDAANRGSEG